MPDTLPAPRSTAGRAWLVQTGAVGLLASVGVVVFAARVGPVRGAWLPTSWFGLAPLTQPPLTSMVVAGYLAVCCVLVLTVAWAVLQYRADRGDVPLAWAWRIALLWAAPLLAGPPLFSSDIYSYAAQGSMLQQGLDPYRFGVDALGGGAALAAVDPRWRGVPSPYGPVASLVERAAATLGNGEVGAVVLLHVFAGLCAIGIGALAASLAPPRRRPVVVLLTVGSPLMLFQVVSAGHLEGLMVLALLAALVLYRRGHVGWALVAAVVAGAVKAPALFAVAALVVHDLAGLPGDLRRRRLAGHLAVVAVAAATCTALVPDGLGWVAGLRAPTTGVTHLAPTSIVSSIAQWVAGVHDPATAQSVDGWCRALGVAAALAYAGWLLLRPRRRAELTVGAGLLVGGALCPVVYPWYLLWGALCLAPVVRTGGRRWLAVLLALAPLQALPGLGSTGGPTGGLFVLATIAVVGGMLWRRAPEPAPRPLPSMPGPAHLRTGQPVTAEDAPWPVAVRLPLA